jgi:hypothetical protein
MVKDMRDVEFKNYSATSEDDDGDEHTHTASVHIATKETADILGTVLTPSGPRDVRAGDVLVATERPGFYDVHSSKVWDDLGYSEDGGNGGGSPLVTSDKDSDKDSDEDSDEESGNPEKPQTTESRTVSKTTPAKATARR